MTPADLSPAALAAAGATLGLSGGLAPGPLSALVVRQSLTHGTREGLKVAMAPVLTDGPLLLAAGFLATRAESLDVLLGSISLVGSAFLLFLAWESARTTSISLKPGDAPTGSALRGVLTNLLNPHAYLFWIVIGGPLVAEAWRQGALSTTAFLVGFFGSLCGAKAGLAWAVGANRSRIGGPVYVWTMRALAAILLLFAVMFAWDGVERLT